MDIGSEIKYLFDYDISDIKNSLLELNQSDWLFNQMRQKTFARDHGKTESIILMWGGSPQKVSATKHLIESVHDAAEKIRSYYGNNARIMTLMLAKLYAKCDIPEHSDAGMLTKIHRCHLAIVTNKDCDFFVNKKKFYFEEGKVIEFNNVMQHSVVNNSDVDRIHLICDIYI
jgi:hypothetical protein